MKIKKYIVNNINEAMVRAKYEFGNDVVLIDQKKIRDVKKYGLKTKLEVTIGIEEKTEEKPDPFAGTGADMPGGIGSLLSGGGEGNSRSLLDEFFRAQADNISEPESALLEDEGGPMAGSRLSMYDETVPLKSAGISLVDEEDIVPSKTSYSLKDMKSRKSSVTDTANRRELIESIKTDRDTMYLGNTFIEQYDFNQEIVDYILDDAFSKDKDVKYMPEKEVLALVKNYFRDYKYYNDIKETKCVTIVGPTGTGKTTTLAKLAAREYLLKGKNVAFITMDTYRIGAVEQLKTYSNILGIPIEIVIDPSEMAEKVEKFKDYDLILIDAVGINYRDDEKVKELKSYFSQIDDLSTYLALNMTLDFRNIKDIIHYYSPFDCVGVILTKIDEVIYYDSVWNYLCDYHMPIGYLCNGQDVPDDILEGSFENIVHMIKKGKELKSR